MALLGLIEYRGLYFVEKLMPDFVKIYLGIVV